MFINIDSPFGDQDGQFAFYASGFVAEARIKVVKLLSYVGNAASFIDNSGIIVIP